jgi:hypothetical protein
MGKRGRFLITALAVVAGIGLLSGRAFAQMAEGSGPKVVFHGDVEVAWGFVNWGESNGASGSGKAVTEMFEADEVQLRGDVMMNDQLSAFFNLRFWNLTDAQANATGATPGTVPGHEPFQTVGSTVFAEVHWKPTSNFEIDAGNFDYPLWSAPMTQEAILFTTPVAYFIQPNYGTSGPVGNNTVFIQENMFLWNGIHGADFNFTAGGAQFGIAASPQCTGLGISSCQSANQNTQSIVPHFYGKFGDLTMNAQIDLVSGTITDNTSTKTYNASSTAWAVGAAYKVNPDIRIALDLQNWDIAKITSMGEDTDQVYNNVGVRFDFQKLMLQYYQTTFNPTLNKASNEAIIGTQTATSSVYTIRYSIPVDGGITLMPEIKSDTLGKQGLSSSGAHEDITNTQVDVIARVAF